MAKLEKTVVSLDSETKRVLNNLTKALEKVAKSQSRLRWTNSPAGSPTMVSPGSEPLNGLRVRLSEPAEDLADTNAAYCEEEWCSEVDRPKKDCHSCRQDSGCDTI